MSPLARDRAAHHDWLASLVSLPAGAVLIDLGCGRGADLQRLAASCHDESVRFIGIENSDAAEDAVRRLAVDEPRIEFRREQLGTRLPFDDGSIDVIFSHNLLECLPDPQGHANEIARILRPGGQVIVGHFVNPEVRRGGRRQELELRLMGLGQEIRINAADIGPVLTAGMPHVNWLGANPSDLAEASRAVEEAEAQVNEEQGDRATVGDDVWHYLLDAALTSGLRELKAWPRAQRFALEMALTEAAEERALMGEVRALEAQHSVAAEVAAIADDLTWTQALTAQFAALKARIQR